jgi:P27 family predicted phage terminase small subunit
MTRGRKPKPTTLKLLAGNPGRRPLNDDEPAPPRGRPDCPDLLKDDEEARAEWDRVCSDLDRMGILCEVDRPSLAAYCVTYSRWVEAERHVQKHGMMVKSPNKGVPMPNPFLWVATSSMGDMRKWLTEFGLTPSSRSRIRVGPNRQASPLDQFLSRGNGRRA